MPLVQSKRQAAPTNSNKRKRTQTLLNKCRVSPSSRLCRKKIYYSRDFKVKGGEPSNRSMTRRSLTRNRSGRIVSKKKSAQSSKRYHSRNSPLRAWNEKVRLATRGPDSPVPFPSAEPVDTSFYEDYDLGGGGGPSDPFDTYSPFKPRRSERKRKPIDRDTGFSYKGRPQR